MQLSIFDPPAAQPKPTRSLNRDETIQALRSARRKLMDTEEWEQKSELHVRIVELEAHLGDTEMARSILYEVFRY